MYYINYSASEKIRNKAIFYFKNKSYSTNSRFKYLQRTVIYNSASKKSLLLGTEVASIDKYLPYFSKNKQHIFAILLLIFGYI